MRLFWDEDGRTEACTRADSVGLGVLSLNSYSLPDSRPVNSVNFWPRTGIVQP